MPTPRDVRAIVFGLARMRNGVIELQVAELQDELEKEQKLNQILQCALHGPYVCHSCVSSLVPLQVSGNQVNSGPSPCKDRHRSDESAGTGPSCGTSDGGRGNHHPGAEDRGLEDVHLSGEEAEEGEELSAGAAASMVAATTETLSMWFWRPKRDRKAPTATRIAARRHNR